VESVVCCEVSRDVESVESGVQCVVESVLWGVWSVVCCGECDVESVECGVWCVVGSVVC